MTTKKPRILCVDGEPENLNALETLLVPEGYDVLTSRGGEEGLRKIAEHKIDLVLLDAGVPGPGGFEVCRKLKADEQYRAVPVVLITASFSKEDRIRGIESGADDVIAKPVDPTEVLARVRMLLKMKERHDRLGDAYRTVTTLAGFGKSLLLSFDPQSFNFLSHIDAVVGHILKKGRDRAGRPQVFIVGYVDDDQDWQWYRFDPVPRDLHRTRLDVNMFPDLELAPDSNPYVFYHNAEDLERSTRYSFVQRLRSLSIPVRNMACFLSNALCVIALNYGKTVTHHDVEVLNGIVVQSLYLKTLATQVKETEEAYDYLVYALARAAEANDEDRGNHIYRVGEYCAVIARELGMSERFAAGIRVQATLHDVGKIHVRPEILQKPGKLTGAEFEAMKMHTLHGARILGDQGRLSLAKKAALSHHENWDGSGYPYGLQGERIPLEGRIVNIADQYDVLRNARVFKPALDHETTCRILVEGDGRTMPRHFDPEALRAFQKTVSQFEEIYERMKD